MNENIIRIKAVSNALTSLHHDVYFVGGAVVSLYADNIGLFEHRVTDDVDVVVEIMTRGRYFQVQERLREIGFKEDHESNIICRYKYQGITVDIMPLQIDILGFSNIWYEDGIKNAVKYTIDDQCEINIFKYPYFLATKFEALNNRNVDWRYSKDFDDIIKTIEARSSWKEEVNESEVEVRLYLKEQFKLLKADMHFLKEAVFCVLNDTDEKRINDIVSQLEI